jgi:hypothetical protein
MTASQRNLPRVFFDPGEGPDNLRYALWLPQSLLVLDQIGAEPLDGMRIVIYAADGGEMEATLEFDRCCDGWTARPYEAGSVNSGRQQAEKVGVPGTVGGVGVR